MNDLSKLSNEQLIQLYQSRQQQAAPVQQPVQQDQQTPDLSKLSNEELTALYQQNQQSKSAGKQPEDQRWGWQKALDDAGLQTMKDFSTGVMKGNVPFSDEIAAGLMTVPGVIKRAITGEDNGKGLMQRASDSYSDALAFNRQTDKAAAERSPIAHTLGQVAGAVNTAGNLAKGGVTLLKPAAPTATKMAVRGAAESAIYSGVYGFGEGEGFADRIWKGTLGAVFGAAIGGVTGGVAGKMATKSANKTIPTIEELSTQAKAAYQAAENAGVVFKPQAYSAAVDDWFSRAANRSLDPTLTPASVAAFKRLEELKGMPLTLQTMEQQRRILNLAAKQAAQIGNAADEAIANSTIRRLDDFVQNNANVLLSGGNPRDAANALKEARSLWRMSAKAEQISNLVENATLRAQNYSQSGMDNALKTEFMALARDPRKLRGFTDAEQELIKKVVNGSPLEKAARAVGKFAVRGPVSAIPTIMAGTATGGVVGPALTMAAGEIGKRTAGAMRMGNVNLLDQLIRSGGNLPTAQITPAQRSILESIIAAQPQLLNRQQAPVK